MGWDGLNRSILESYVVEGQIVDEVGGLVVFLEEEGEGEEEGE